MRHTLLIFCILFLRLSFAQPSGWVTEKTDNYEVSFPSAWTYSIPDDQSAQFILMSPLSSEKDKFQENFSVMTEDLSDNPMNLEMYAQIGKSGLASQIEKFKLQEEKTGKNELGEYRQIIFSGKIYGMKVHWVQRYYIIDDIAYVMTASMHKKASKEFIPTVIKVMDYYRIP